MRAQVERFLEAWITGTDGVTYTPAGLAWGSEWGSLRFVGNAAMIAAVYSKSIAGARPSFVIQGTLKQTLLNQAVIPLHSETFGVVWTLVGVKFLEPQAHGSSGFQGTVVPVGKPP